MARRYLGQMACWLKLLAKLAKREVNIFGLGAKEAWVNGKELAKHYFLLAFGELDEWEGRVAPTDFPALEP